MRRERERESNVYCGWRCPSSIALEVQFVPHLEYPEMFKREIGALTIHAKVSGDADKCDRIEEVPSLQRLLETRHIDLLNNGLVLQ